MALISCFVRKMNFQYASRSLTKIIREANLLLAREIIITGHQEFQENGVGRRTRVEGMYKKKVMSSHTD